MPKRYYGYIRIKKPEHPHTDHGWILEHRYVVEQHIGRYLTSQEAIHHINGNRKDNRLENLQLIRFGDHSRLENTGRHRTEQEREKISLARKGKRRAPFSDEWKKKLSESGRRYWQERRYADRMQRNNACIIWETT